MVKRKIQSFTSVIIMLAMICTLLFPAMKTEAAGYEYNMDLYSVVDAKEIFWISGNVSYTTSDKNIVRIVNNELLAVKPGSVTITATQGGQTTQRKVTVKNYSGYFKLNSCSVTLTKGETFQLYAEGTPATPKYSSKKKSVATVSKTGKVTAKSVGTTTITARSGNMKSTCIVTVMPKSARSKVIKLDSKSGMKHYKSWSFKEKSKYILAIHPGTYLPKNFEKDLDGMIYLLEKKSGYKLHPTSSDIRSRYDKAVIWVGGFGGTYNTWGSMQISSEDLYLRDDAALTVGRWITNEILARNNTYYGDVFGSSLGTTVARRALADTRYVSKGFNIMPKKHMVMDTKWKHISSSRMAKYLTNTSLDTEAEQLFSEYIYSKYGMSTIRKILKEVNAQNRAMGVTGSSALGIDNRKILDIAKSKTSKSLVSNFIKWGKTHLKCSHGPLEDEPSYTVTRKKTLKVRPGGFTVKEFWRIGAVKFQDNVTIDFTEAMKFYELNCGQKVTGLYDIRFVVPDKKYKIYVYDKNNKLIATYDETKGNCVNEDGAVKVRVESKKGFLGFLSPDYVSAFNKYTKVRGYY